MGSGITLLADPGAATVAAFDLLDSTPFPSRTQARSATLLIDREGRVVRWWIAKTYRKRPSPDAILAAID